MNKMRYDNTQDHFRCSYSVFEGFNILWFTVKNNARISGFGLLYNQLLPCLLCNNLTMIRRPALIVKAGADQCLAGYAIRSVDIRRAEGKADIPEIMLLVVHVLFQIVLINLLVRPYVETPTVESTIRVYK